MNETEHKKIKKLADSANMNMAEYLRDNAGKRLVINRKDQLKLIAAINRCGNNLNQIAHWCNTYKSSADTAQVLTHLIKIERMVKGLKDAD